MTKRIAISSTLAVGIIALFGLGLMAYLGFYNRYWSDDWCYERDLNNLGLTGTMNGYFFTGDDAIRGYSTNRYSLTLLTAILALPGIEGTQILPGLIISFLIGVLFWLLSYYSDPKTLPKIIILPAAVIFTYYLLYFSPHRFQILYWRAGVHYTAAIIITLLMLCIIISQMRREKNNRMVYFTLAFLGLLGGGLSEIGSVFMVTGFSLLLLIVYQARKQREEWARKAFPMVALVLIVLLIAMTALILSPSNDRYKEKSDNPIPIYFIPLLAPQFASSFIFQSFKSLPLPHLMFILFFIALGIITGSFSSGNFSIAGSRLGILIFLILGVVFILITAIQVPTTYFYSAPPDARGQSLSRFALLAGLALTGWLIGRAIGTGNNKKWGRIFAALTMLVISVYTIRMIYINFSELPGFIRRAELWDARDAMIRAAVDQGKIRIEVPVIDTSEIDTRDIMRSKNMDEWVSNCTTEYYQLEAFHAISP